MVGQFKTNTGLYGAIFAKGSKLLKPVNKAIKKLEADGTLEQLAQDNLTRSVRWRPERRPVPPAVTDDSDEGEDPVGT